MFQDVCIPIMGCSPLTPSFYINGQVYAWPYFQQPYNLIINSTDSKGNLSACLRNVSINIMLTEFCHSSIPEGVCALCSRNLGIINFRSRAHVTVWQQESKH